MDWQFARKAQIGPAVFSLHEYKVCSEVKLPAGKIIIPCVVCHASDIVGREKVIASTDCGLGRRVHSQNAWAKLRVLCEGAALASKKLWGCGGEDVSGQVR